MPHVQSRPEGPAPEPTGPRVVSPARSASPAAVSPVGKWQGQHPAWSAAVEIRPDGEFSTTFSGGKWYFDGKRLELAWHEAPSEVLELQVDGTFRLQKPNGTFSLRKA